MTTTSGNVGGTVEQQKVAELQRIEQELWEAIERAQKQGDTVQRDKALKLYTHVQIQRLTLEVEDLRL